MYTYIHMYVLCTYINCLLNKHDSTQTMMMNVLMLVTINILSFKKNKG